MKQYQFELTYGTTSEILTINPDGWDRLGLSFVRNKTYHGIIRSFAMETYKFVIKSGGGGQFIIDAYEEDGISAEVSIDISVRNPQTNDYDLWFSGILDFNPDSYKRDYKNGYVEIGVIDSSKLQKFMSRDEIELDITKTISLDNVTVDAFVNSPKEIAYKPIDIFLHVDIIANLFEEFTGAPWNINLEDSQLADVVIYPYSNLTTDRVTNETGDRLTISSTALYSSREAKIYENTTGQVVTILISELAPQVNPMYHTGIDLGAGNTYDAILTIYLVTKTSEDAIITNQTVAHKEWSNVYEAHAAFNLTWNDITDELTIPAGGYIELSMVYERGANWINSRSYIEGRLELSLVFTEKTDGRPETEVTSYFPHEAFARLVQLMTSETDQLKLFYSTFFGRTDSEFVTYTVNGEGALDAINNGLLLRGFPNTPLTLSFKKLFKSFDARYNLGMAYDRVNDRFYIEAKSAFYDSTYFMFDLGEVSELIIHPYKDMFYSQVESGYDEVGEYENFGGVNEFNIQSNHGVIYSIKETLSIRSDYNSDSIGIEKARRSGYYMYSSKDTKQDGKVYITRTDGTEAIQGGTGLSGFEGIEQYYNLCFTPRENLIRWGNWLKITLWKLTKRVKWLNSSKKINIRYTNQNAADVYEHNDLGLIDFPDEPLFNPEYAELKAPITLAILQILNTNPHGIIRFTYETVTYEGFLDEVQTEDYNKTASWKLILKDPTSDSQKVFMDGSTAVFMDGDKHKLL